MLPPADKTDVVACLQAVRQNLPSRWNKFASSHQIPVYGIYSICPVSSPKSRSRHARNRILAIGYVFDS